MSTRKSVTYVWFIKGLLKYIYI